MPSFRDLNHQPSDSQTILGCLGGALCSALLIPFTWVGVLVPIEGLKDVLFYVFLERNWAPCPIAVLLLAIALPWFLHSLPSIIRQLFETS